MTEFKRGLYLPNKYLETLCYAVAFDPGETTGWAVMGIRPDYLDDSESKGLSLGSFQDRISYIDYGEIDCVSTGGFDDMANKHAGIALGAEAVGVSKMLDIIWKFRDPAIVVEDFIIDFSKIDQARHTLSPVRIMSMLSYAAYVEAQTPFVSRLFVQNRSMAKTTCTDERLKNWGLYDRNSGRHSRDAVRHAYYFLRTCRGPDPKTAEKRWRAWPDRFSDPWAHDGADAAARKENYLDNRARAEQGRQRGERVRFVKKGK